MIHWHDTFLGNRYKWTWVWSYQIFMSHCWKKRILVVELGYGRNQYWGLWVFGPTRTVRVMCLILPETLTVRFECSALNYDNWNVTLVFNLQFYVWIITLKGFITVLCFPVIFKEYNTFSHRDREILFKNLINIQLAIIIIINT